MIDSKKGYGITFMDLDETLFKTFAKVHVVKENKLLKKLSNQEFNKYTLQEGEKFDFCEFGDAKLFKETSIPIPRTIDMITDMLEKIKETKSLSRIIILTARPNFEDKELFLKKFIESGIDVSNKEIFYIHRLGDLKVGTIPERKKEAILKYLSQGIYRRCRMIEDSKSNLDTFLALASSISDEILNKVREKYKLSKNEIPIKFYALHMQDNGELKKYNK